jgi:hypothetical protein
VAAWALVLAACGSEAPPPAPVAVAPPRPAPAAGQPPAGEERRLAPVTYRATGRPDPFQPLDVAGGSRGLSVASTRLTGIIRGTEGALALVEAPDGLGYILRAGDTLGDGRLDEIGQDSAIFTVAPVLIVPPSRRTPPPPTRVTLRLGSS